MVPTQAGTRMFSTLIPITTAVHAMAQRIARWAGDPHPHPAASSDASSLPEGENAG